MNQNGTRAKKRFVVCLSNRGYPASLERRKLYVVLADAQGAKAGLLRVIDESGEDYLYPRDRFAPVSLRPSIAAALSIARRGAARKAAFRRHPRS